MACLFCISDGFSGGQPLLRLASDYPAIPPALPVTFLRGDISHTPARAKATIPTGGLCGAGTLLFNRSVIAVPVDGFGLLLLSRLSNRLIALVCDQRNLYEVLSMIKFFCAGCGQKIQVSDDFRGTVVTCPTCHVETGVPSLPPRNPPPVPASTPPRLPVAGHQDLQPRAQGVITGAWAAPTRKCRTFCPSCHNKIISRNVNIPRRCICPRCRHQYDVSRVTYPILPFMGSTIALVVLTVFAACFPTWAAVEKVAPYAGLFGIGESQLFPRKFIIWFPTVLIPLLLLVVLVAYYGCERSRRHLKLSPATTIMGGASTLGWIITLPYLSAWLVFGSLALQGHERENQEYYRSQHEGWREIENRRIQELLERPRIPVR